MYNELNLTDELFRDIFNYEKATFALCLLILQTLQLFYSETSNSDTIETSFLIFQTCFYAYAYVARTPAFSCFHKGKATFGKSTMKTLRELPSC